MRLSSLLFLVLFTVSCAPKRPPFLFYPEHRDQRIGQRNPHSPYADMICMTKVTRADHKTYLTLKGQGRIVAEQRRGKYIYFAIQSHRYVPLDGAGSPMVAIDTVERYRARLPAGEKSP